jgi:hypothetical protein
MRLEEKRKFWRAHITAWQRSGLSKGEYCRQHGLVLKQMWYWLRRHRREAMGEAVTLVPVQLKSEAIDLPPPSSQEAQPSPLVLQNGSGWQLLLPSSVAPEWLAGLLRGLS